MQRLCAFAAVALLGACSSNPTPIPPESPDDGRKPFFWRIEGGGAPAPSHLLGTFHIGVEPDEVLTPGVWTALDHARAVVLEVNIATTDSLGLGMHKPGASLRQQMTAAEWDELVSLLGIEEADARKLEQIKLWAVYTSVLGELAPQTESIDTELQRRAGTKPLVFLEQVGFQERLFDKYINAAMLLSLLRDKKGQKAKLASQSEAYRSGDVDRMYRESVAPESFAGAPPGFRDEILIDRNKAWMAAITREVDAGGAFIAVGASHLLGQDGLLDLLEKAGYRVTRAR